MWGIHGRIAFLAEDQGASSVTALDIMAETDQYRAEHQQRESKVRFVHGDLHDPETIRRAGPHQVAWCSGVLYHVPNPLVTIECLRQLTAETLILSSATIPEVPGIENASVFFPHLSSRARESFNRMYDATRTRGGMRFGLTTPFDAAKSYDNWWWGLTPSAIGAMLQVGGFRVTEMQTNGFSTRIIAEKT